MGQVPYPLGPPHPSSVSVTPQGLAIPYDSPNFADAGKPKGFVANDPSPSLLDWEKRRLAAKLLSRARGNLISIPMQLLAEHAHEWLKPRGAIAARMDPGLAGWTHICSVKTTCSNGTPRSPINFQHSASANGSCYSNCATPGPAGTVLPVYPATVAPNVTSLLLSHAHYYPALAGHRVATNETWERRNASGNPYRPPQAAWAGRHSIVGDPFPVPGRSQPATSPWPNILPELVPSHAPGPLPAPRPFHAPQPSPLPGVEPAYQPRIQPGPGRAPRPRPSYRPRPDVEIFPQPGPQPGPGIVITPAPDPVPGSPPGTKPSQPKPGSNPFARPGQGGAARHKFAPPKRGEKEIKPGGGAAFKAAGHIFGAATEGLDLLDAAWKALSKNGGWQTKVDGKPTTPAQKAKDIYNSVSKPKFNTAGFFADFAKNAAINQLQDAAIGKVGSASKKGAKKAAAAGVAPHGSTPFGYGFGPAI